MQDIKLMAAPADKSMPPEITTNAWPNDAKPNPMGWIKNTFFQFRVLVKNSLAKVEKTMIAANITHTSRSGSIHRFTILFKLSGFMGLSLTLQRTYSCPTAIDKISSSVAGLAC